MRSDGTEKACALVAGKRARVVVGEAA